MEEALIIQTIISNMSSDKKVLYRLHLDGKHTYTKLRKLIEAIEDENTENATNYESEYINQY
ncbi:hypothetical protein GVAV_002708 [Gurleya vavrai]